MKRFLTTILVIAMLIAMIALPGTALADSGEVNYGMSSALIECGVQIAATLVITLIGVFGAWLTRIIGKSTQLQNINAAQNEVIKAAKITVGELQQTVVDGLKAASKDGKLTKQEIGELGDMLIDKTLEKLSGPTYALLKASAVDVEALIVGAGENWISELKRE